MGTQKVKPETVEMGMPLGAIIRVHFFLRHSIFPSCAIHFLEWVESDIFEDGESRPETELDKVHDFFHIILSSFWWLTTLAHGVMYSKKNTEESREDSRQARVMLAASYVIILEHVFSEAQKYLDQEEFMEWINSELSLKNAGIVFGSFTEYRALSVAMGFVINIYGNHIKTKITNIFGENVVWDDIYMDDTRLEKLFDEMMEIFSTYMPPVTDWPEWRFWLDAKSFTYKLCAEFTECEDTEAGSHIKTQNHSLTTNQSEKNILETIGRDILTGPQIAKKSGYPYGRNLKAKLSELVKRDVLDNKRGQGYSLNSEYYPLLEIIKST